MFQGHSLSRSRPEGVSLSAPGARKSQSFPQKQRADPQADFVGNPADCNPLPQERLHFLTNDPGMSMKTNSRGVEELRGQFKRSGRMVTVCHSSTLDSRLLDSNSTEQSENVYENKGQGQKVDELRSRAVEEEKAKRRPRIPSPGRSRLKKAPATVHPLPQRRLCDNAAILSF